ncbi:alpha/beta hydrolase [Catenovulum sediminis]|uniref:alpha/beta hydrolase n=1 Tax=Catenovulum sediminis TaxID=1740262 RepID=UPI00117DFF9D|nr:alpha/beta fold hydrolase [Catenovulum sediminis]
MSILRLEVSNPKFTPDNTQIVTIHSSHLNRRHDVSYYNTHARGNDLPIIVLLHGVYGNHWVWLNLGGVDLAYKKVKAEFGIQDFILVMPSDGGLFDGSGYLPTHNHGDYESWIVDDVIEASIQTLEQVTEQSRVYISGLSMGGYGALRLGAKYPDKFSAISAHSSITELADLKYFVDTDLTAYQCTNNDESNLLYWMEKQQTKLPPLRLDCGLDDELYQSNLKLIDKMNAAKIPHQFEVFEGGHSWEYWHVHVQKTFRFFNEIESRY